MKTGNSLAVRWIYLAVGVFTMLFSGVLYAWSILKAPLAAEFGWGNTYQLFKDLVKIILVLETDFIGNFEK